MRTGRPPVPTALKLLRGTARRHRLNRAEPRPRPGAPAMPATLPADARPAWRWYVRLLRPMRVLTKADQASLALLAMRTADYLRLRQLVETAGATYTTRTASGSEMYRQRPEVGLMIAAWRDVARLLAEFGLSPSARTRVASIATPEAPEDELEAFLKAPPERRGRA